MHCIAEPLIAEIRIVNAKILKHIIFTMKISQSMVLIVMQSSTAHDLCHLLHDTTAWDETPQVFLLRNYILIVIKDSWRQTSENKAH